MLSATKAYLRDEGGAVTVDWVVLTAAVVGLGMATIAVVSAGTEDLSRDIDDQLNVDHITASFGSPAFASAWGEFDMMNPYSLDQAWWDDWAANGNWKFEGSSNEALMTRYEAAYSGFHEGTDGWDQGEALDGIGAAEAEMVRRGMEIPEGNQTYAEMYASMDG